MKNIYKAIVFCLLAVPSSTLVYAAEQETPPCMQEAQGTQEMPCMQGKSMQSMGMPGMGMHSEMMSKMMSPEHLKEMQAHMLLMHDLSNKILAEKDPKKQQALKDQQLELMKAHMTERMKKHHEMRMKNSDSDKK